VIRPERQVVRVPIRSPRGRSAAYRVLWQWPLRSPARLGFTAVLLLVAVVVGVAGLGALRLPTSGSAVADGPSATARPPAGNRTAPSVTPTVLPPVPDLTPSTLPLSAAPAPALSAAARWSAAWVNHKPGMSAQQWVAGLQPFTTDEYLGTLTDVDPANIPATKVTGEPRAVRVAARSVSVTVPTNALTLTVLVVSTENGWRVAGYDKG
jgi:hypothetical protein